MRRFLFLDIDGVLSTNKTYKNMLHDNYCHFDEDAVCYVKQLLIAFPEIEIIISSSWRLALTVPELREVFRIRGCNFHDRIIDKTPYLNYDNTDHYTLNMSVPRGCEIDMWLRKNTADIDRYRYVILDDDSDMMLWQKDNFVQTNVHKGISQMNVFDAIRILGEEA